MTQPLDREEKDEVSKTNRRFMGNKARSCAHEDLRAEEILLNTRTTTPEPPNCVLNLSALLLSTTWK